GFVPDFVLFGKNVQICGVARIRREGQSAAQWVSALDSPVVTLHAGADPAQLLRAAQYLKRIREGKLIDNARDVGNHLLDRVGRGAARGLGFLLHFGGRLMPALTLSKEDVDRRWHQRVV